MDNEKLDHLFDMEKMEKTIKNAKRRANWKTVLITVFVIAALVVVGYIANQKITRGLEGPISISARGFHEISAPNEFIGKHEEYPGILGGRNQYTTYKIIEGKVVYTGEKEYGYGLFRDELLNRTGMSSPILIWKSHNEEDLEKQRYNELGQREMVFFYPFLQYKIYRNDLALLDDIGEDKVMEVALSFDQGYSLKEVQSMIPNDVTLSWVWIDDVNEEEDSFQVKERDMDGKVIRELDNLVRSEYTVYGVSLLNADGNKAEDPVTSFISTISSGQKYKARWQGEYKRLYETLSGEDGELSGNDLRYYGAVVTGNVETLSQLKGLPFIKASSIGVVTDKY